MFVNRHETTANTLVTTQHLPQPLPQPAYIHQPYGGQPMSTGPPLSYQEAVGPGYPVPIQCHFGQLTLPLSINIAEQFWSGNPFLETKP
ncbi:hypothetical protein Q8A67_005758 [Cirrhinus molitorella]|uniref:Uncharacterized protein n=1 Tax=Cirrhinus molitorella TaxID=172907 RepID=A0AA88TSX7_9TELE|nr:hypothetical protein Q8A67_005758 [Cirrhinus molitorella]